MKFPIVAIALFMAIASDSVNAICCVFASDPGECGFVKRSIQEDNFASLQKRGPLGSLITCCCQAGDASACATECVSIWCFDTGAG
ncbi:hypothetical protein BC629DRAFT_1461631 [Irpex lacteus]|nr:hypothetical protein BC629DRAFT_1461631 [Irpex lacteus]